MGRLIHGRHMLKAVCCDCRGEFHRCRMSTRLSGKTYCFACLDKAVAEGREQVERTYSLNGRNCTLEEFIAGGGKP